jgi:uncharacterized FlaG/YvyC family protein
VPAAKTQPKAQPAKEPPKRPEQRKVEPTALQSAPFARTYTEIRIDDTNKVSVKVFNADNDEVILQAPPDGLASMLDMMPPGVPRPDG